MRRLCKIPQTYYSFLTSLSKNERYIRRFEWKQAIFSSGPIAQLIMWDICSLSCGIYARKQYPSVFLTFQHQRSDSNWVRFACLNTDLISSLHRRQICVTSSAKLNATVHRWLLELAEFNFTIKRHRGHKNHVADALSRMSLEEYMYSRN